MDQLNIFDFVGYPDFHDLDNEEIAAVIGGALGIEFKPDTRFSDNAKRYYAEVQKMLILEVEKAKYLPGINDEDPEFISLGFSFLHGDYYGGGSCCHSFEEAIEIFKEKIGRIPEYENLSSG